MKKTCGILITLLLILFLCACTDTQTETGTANTTDITDTTTTESEEQKVPETEPISYEDIERREARAYQTNCYGFRDEDTLLNIALPIEWSLELYDGGYDIIRDGKGVGRLYGGSDMGDDTLTVYQSKSHLSNGVSVTQYIEGIGSEYQYRYVYTYFTDDSMYNVTLTADLAEIDATSEQKLLTSAFLLPKKRSETAGILSHYLGDGSSILILGNSFVSTSKIGNILNEMFAQNDKSCQVKAISRGYARVSTYTSDATLMAEIRGGKYDAVFLCGLYDTSDVPNVGIMIKACKQGLTKLIIFPAHNEYANAVAKAQQEYDDVILLNWKAELDGLIEGNGVDMWDLCIDDSHKHSTPLAGYVGAHMIYRAIYDEMPKKPMQYTIGQNYIDSILGNYAYVGDAKIIDNITYLD